MEFVEAFLKFIGVCALLHWALHQGRKAIVKLIAEGGSFVSDIKKAARKAIHKIKNS